MKRHLVPAIIGIAAVTLTACGTSGGTTNAGGADGPLRVGLLLDLSGAAAPFGLPERDAAEAVIKSLNSSDALKGRKIEFSVYDSSTDATECARGATSLIRDKKVVAIVGGTTGSCTLAAAPVAARAKVPMLAPNGTIDITKPGTAYADYVFRTATSDLVNTKLAFEKATANGAKKIGVFYQEDAYGENTAKYINELAGKAGLSVSVTASAPLTATDLTAAATKLRNGNPDVVLMQISSPKLGSSLVRAAQQVGLDAPLWGGIGLAQRGFVDASGAAGNGVHLVAFGNPYEPDARTQPLLKLLQGKKLDGFAELLATNGVVSIVEAAKKVDGAYTGEKMRDALSQQCGVQTYSAGEVCYQKSQDGWDDKALVVVTIKDDKLVTQK